MQDRESEREREIQRERERGKEKKKSNPILSLKTFQALTSRAAPCSRFGALGFRAQGVITTFLLLQGLGLYRNLFIPSVRLPRANSIVP